MFLKGALSDHNFYSLTASALASCLKYSRTFRYELFLYSHSPEGSNRYYWFGRFNVVEGRSRYPGTALVGGGTFPSSGVLESWSPGVLGPGARRLLRYWLVHGLCAASPGPKAWLATFEFTSRCFDRDCFEFSQDLSVGTGLLELGTGLLGAHCCPFLVF